MKASVCQHQSLDVFAHNKLSSLLDTGKPLEQILAKSVSAHVQRQTSLSFICSPVEKYVDGKGVSSLLQATYVLAFRALRMLINFREGVGLRSMAELPDHMANYELCMSDSSTSAPFCAAHGGTLWEYMSRPGNEATQTAFSAAMVVYERTFPPNLILQGTAFAVGIPNEALTCLSQGSRGKHLKLVASSWTLVEASAQRLDPFCLSIQNFASSWRTCRLPFRTPVK
jgi:hypothetical protein